MHTTRLPVCYLCVLPVAFWSTQPYVLCAVCTAGPAAVAQLTLDSTKAPGPGTHDLGTFTLMVRVPEWLAPDRHGGVAQGGSGASIEVNGQVRPGALQC